MLDARIRICFAGIELSVGMSALAVDAVLRTDLWVYARFGMVINLRRVSRSGYSVYTRCSNYKQSSSDDGHVSHSHIRLQKLRNSLQYIMFTTLPSSIAGLANTHSSRNHA